MTQILQIPNYLLLAFGFGFVIFFHELGHFLAAKYSDVKVEQFAVGFGPAIFAWRKGIGFRWGTTNLELKKRTEAYLEAHRDQDLQLKEHVGEWTDAQLTRAAHALGLGETEYRLNWVPLGGYVKMLGQDDLRPEATVDDPRAYNNKSISSRMLIVSAGVVMNVILAAIGFMIVFLLGYPAPAARVGMLVSASPALKATHADGSPAPLRPGDEIITFDGKATHGDFTKIILNVALSEEGASVPVVVRRHGPDDKNPGPLDTVYVTPARVDGDPKGFLALGINQPVLLKGPDPKTTKQEVDDKTAAELEEPDALAIKPGDTVVQVDGQDVNPDEIWKLADALDRSDGKPVILTIKTADGNSVRRPITPHFQGSFSGRDDLDFLGLVPRASVINIREDSPARGKLHPGDVIATLTDAATGDRINDPSAKKITDVLNSAGKNEKSVTMGVISLASNEMHSVEGLTPTLHLGKDHIGLGIGLGYDEQHAVVADVRKGSPLDKKLKTSDAIVAIDNQPVHNWFDVRRILAGAKPGQTLTLNFTRPGEAKPQSATVTLSDEDIAAARMITIVSPEIQFQAMQGDRKTSNPFVAITWGVVETRDLILQFYLTLQRMVTGGVSYKNTMGPVGIFAAGAQFADKGASWLIWFLAMISANLAVVNFLPFIPIVDGGLFMFLVLEKIQGRPLSPYTQKIVQVVGLALILGVFLLVTYQDIARMTGNLN